MLQLSPNIDILFAEAGDAPADRVRAAAAAGFTAVEIWGTLEKDVDALVAVLEETGVTLTSLVAEPRTNFTWPGTDLGPYWDGLERGLAHANRLGCERIVLGSGLGFPGMKRAQNLERLVDTFRTTVERFPDAGVTFLLEPVNTRVDHPGALADRTAEAVEVARAVDSPHFKILYDLYHSVVEGEDPVAELANAGEMIGYVQVADHPGRGEPGTGTIDWPAQFAALTRSSYRGPVGLEYFPTRATLESLEHIRAVAGAAGAPVAG